MNRTLTERKVLKKLDIPDFRHMTKDKVVTFVSMLHRMDPEVAKAALAQFPAFASTAIEITELLKDAISRMADSNERNLQAVNDACMSMLASLREQLSREEIGEQERARIIDTMMEVITLMSEKDSENKRFLSGLVKYITFGAALVFTCLAAALGVKAASQWFDGWDDD